MSLKKNVSTLISGTVIGQVIPFLFLPLLSRVYSPDDFGHYGLFYELTTFLLVVSSLNYERAVVIEQNLHAARVMMMISISANMLVSLLLVPVTLLAGGWLGNYIGVSDTWLLVVFIPLITLISGYGNVLKYYCIREGRYNVISRSNIIRSLSAQVLTLVLAYTGFKSYGLLAGYALGTFVENRFIAYSVSCRYRDVFNKAYIADVKLLMRKYFKLPTYSLFNSVVNEVSLKLPTYIFNSYFSKFFIGQFFQARRITLAPGLIVGDAFKKVLFQKMSYNYANGISSYTLVKKIYTRFILAGILPCTVVMIWGRELAVFVLGSNWAVCGDILRIIIVSILLQVAYIPLSTYFEIIMEQKITLAWNIGMIAAKAGAILVGVSMHSFYWALIFFSAATALGYLLITGIAFHKIKSNYNGKQVTDLHHNMQPAAER